MILEIYLFLFFVNLACFFYVTCFCMLHVFACCMFVHIMVRFHDIFLHVIMFFHFHIFSCPDKMIFLEDLFIFYMLSYMGISRLYLCIEHVVFG